MTEHNMSGPSKEYEIGAGSSGMLASSEMEGEDEYYNPDGTEWSQKAGLLCRICANPNEYLIPIFDGEGLEHELGTKIQKHLPIKVTETDTLPIHVCYQCASTLIAWHDLVNCCVEADKKLRELQMVEDDEDDDDKGAEMFESHSFDSEMVAEDDGPSTSELQNQAPEIKSPKKLTVDKKSKLKMVLVKGSAAGTSGQKIVPKIQVAKVELGKPKEGTSQDSASERCSKIVKKVLKPPPSSVPVRRTNIVLRKPVQPLILKNEKNSAASVQQSPNKSNIVVKELKNTYKKPAEISSPLRKSHTSLSSKVEYVRHMCNICGRKYLTKKSLREHTKKHFQKRAKCDICGKTYRNENVLKSHISLHTGPQPYICQPCGKGFIFLSSLKQHLKIDHKEKYERKCEICGKVLTSEQRFKNHQMIHNKAKFDGKEGPTTSHICQKCGKSFKRTASLRVHEQHIHQGIPKQHICEVCGMMFHVGAKLRRHMVKHTGERPFVCETCGMRFGTKHLLKNHQVCHSDLRPHKCKICGKAFKRQRNMRGHEQNMHSLVNARSEQEKDGISYPCTVCEKEFSTKQKVTMHMRCHTGHFVGFSCDICGKVLSSKHGRDNHIRTHTGERPYVCKVCGLALKTRAQLHAHSETHTDKKPFPCTICNKRFRRRPHLEGHLRTHTGEKPFVCNICGRGFSQNGDMKKHRLKLHNASDLKH